MVRPQHTSHEVCNIPALSMGRRVVEIHLAMVLPAKQNLLFRMPSCQTLPNHFRVIFRPFGIWLGIRPSVHRSPSPNPILERNFLDKKLTDDRIAALAQECGMTTRQVERWIRKRKLQNKPSMIEKFAETG